MPMRWQRSDVQLNELFSRGDETYEVVGIADEPTVILRNLDTGVREQHVITSLLFGQFRKCVQSDPKR
jgi:hypothetical protein